jgi:protease I
MTMTNAPVKVAFLATEGTEQVEWEQPWAALKSAGASPVLLTPGGGDVQFFDHIDRGKSVPADEDLAHANPRAFDALVLPGGVIGSDFLRADDQVVTFVREFSETGRPIAAICHAGWILIEAGVVKGKTLTSYPSLQTDLANAGANWIDKEVVQDGPLITSRRPDDLEAFSKTIISHLFPADGTT